MSRRGVEEKPPWSSVPRGVRAKVEEIVGARVARGERVYGGYGPTPTFRLRLADGSGVFFKATSPASNEFSHRALDREERNYRELAPILAEWAPAFRGAFQRDGWHVLLLGDVGPKSVPPWTPARARIAARELARFHRSTLDQELPDWLVRPGRFLGRFDWPWIGEETDDFQILAALSAERSTEAREWFRQAAPVLQDAIDRWRAAPERLALLHGDVRSDNLRLAGSRLILLDWPHAVVGAPEYDLVEFAQSVAVEEGPAPEAIVAAYAEVSAVDEIALNGAISWWASFFADTFWRPEIPGLPRLRLFQRQQLEVLLDWAARAFALPSRPELAR